MVFEEAEQRLRAMGLLVRTPRPDYLLIATGVTVAGQDSIQVFEDACALIGKGDGQYVAVLPSAGHIPVDVPGTLDELVPLIERVYRHHRGSSDPLSESVREVVLQISDWSQASISAKT